MSEDTAPGPAKAVPDAREQSIWDLFETDNNVEVKGVLLRYSPTIRVLVARAGGANKKFERVMMQLTKPHRQLLKVVQSGQGSADDAKALEAIIQETYAKTVVLGWEGFTEKDGSEMQCTPDNIMKVFQALPQLWSDIRDFASNYMNYMAEDTEEVAKN